MPAARIFVCYALSGDERGAEVAQQLIGDLQARGASVVTDDEGIAEEDFVKYLDQELTRCQYCILVQTPQALKSLRVQTAVNMALNLVAQQRMKGVLRILAAPVDSEDEQPLWVTPRSFDASRDYPRARDKILLELGLLSVDDEVPELGDQLTPFSINSSTIVLPAGESPNGLFLNNQPTTLIRRASGLLDRPQRSSSWYRSSRLWISMVSAILILAIMAGIGVVATQAKNGVTNVPNHTVSSASTRQNSTRVPTTTTATTAPTATPTTTVPTATPTTHQTTPTLPPTPVHQTIVDDLNDWSKTYSHTTNLSFDTDNSQWMHGDTSLLYRETSTPAEVVWKLPGVTSFQAIAYFWPRQSASPLNDLSVYTSADGVHWTAATPTISGGTGNWIEYTYTLSNLSNVNFVQMRWSVTMNNAWSQQIGQVTLNS